MAPQAAAPPPAPPPPPPLGEEASVLDELLREGLLETGDLVLFNRSVTQSVRQSVSPSVK